MSQHNKLKRVGFGTVGKSENETVRVLVAHTATVGRKLHLEDDRVRR